jgi:diguanylate cyclase (GGDEF)-like protein
MRSDGRFASNADQAPYALDRENGDGRSSSVRDEPAIQRDAVARQRDELAAERDREATARDAEADALDINDERFDKQSLQVQELRDRAAFARRRAAAGREQARRDRHQAAQDRERAASDRDLAARERRLAGTDELTGARRRGVGLEEFEREIGRALRTHGRLSAVFVDVDGLKSVNDALGHGAGDQLLCEVVAALKRHMRSYDLVVRLGGDEFLCVLADVTPEQVRTRFEGLNAGLQNGPANGSVSLGFSELQNGDSAADLMNRADRDLLAGRAEQRTSARFRR